MIGALIIVFREVLEAGLIVGIVLAASKSIPRRGRWIALGVSAGFVGACTLAIFAGVIGQLFNGSGQELLNATVLFSAVAMLGWHNIWMSTHGRELSQNAKHLGREVASGRKKLTALAIVVALAVMREGSEVVLFLYGLLASGGDSWQQVMLGGLCGLLLGAAISTLLYGGLVVLPVRHFFTATTVLLTFLAAGLAAQGVAFLQQGGYLERWSAPIWNTGAILPETSWLGRVLHTLIGYSERPSGMQLLIYLSTLGVIVGLMRWTVRGAVASKPS
jgi:high-affinity iron transporter